MARHIINTTYRKGITLIELVLYMGIFSILVSGVLYSALYLEKVMEYNAYEYKAREQIYKQIELIQQYMAKAKDIVIQENGIKINTSQGSVTQHVRDGKLYMIYEYANQEKKEFLIYPYATFVAFRFEKLSSAESLHTKSIYTILITRIDAKGREKTMEEYVTIRAVDF